MTETGVLHIIIIVLLTMITAGYVALIVSFATGWSSLKRFEQTTHDHTLAISVIVPVRNEENNIASLIGHLTGQNYPHDLYEIIIVDDDSEDRTRSKVWEQIKKHRKHHIILSGDDVERGKFRGKKDAISNGIRIATGKLIVTTDADCRMGKDWLATIVAFYQTFDPKMIIAPVIIGDPLSLYEEFQSLELLSLVGSGAGSAAIGKPIMCNGANLAYEKSAFRDAGGYEENRDFASGDDVFLLHKMKKHFGPASIMFLKSARATVSTGVKSSMVDFLNQRIRWISKSRGYRDRNIIITAITVYLFNFALFSTFIAGIFFSTCFIYFLFLFAIKLIIDFAFLAGISRFTKQGSLMIFYPVFQVIYIPFVTIMGLLGNILGFKWKGRRGRT